MTEATPGRMSLLFRALTSPERRVLVLWLAIAAALRVPPALTVDLSLDETWTWVHTSELLRVDAQTDAWRTGLDAPLFVAINFAIAKTAGLSVFGLRVPALVFGTASVAVAYFLLRQLTDGRNAMVATAMTALSPFLVYYSMEARPYAQLLFFCLGFSLVFQSSAALPLWKRRSLLSLSTLLCVASHYYAMVFLAAFYLALGVHHVRRRAFGALRREAVTGVCTLVLVLPLLLLPLRRLGAISVDYWASANSGLTVTFGEQLWFMGLNYTLRPGLAQLAEAGIALLWAAPIAIALRRGNLASSGPLLLSLGWLPAVLAIAAGFALGRSVLFYSRGFIASVPFLFLLWIQALATLNWPQRWLFAYVGATTLPALLMTFFVTAGRSTHPYLGDRGAMKAVAEEVNRHAQDDDIIVVHHWWMAQFLYYYSKAPERVRGLATTRDVALHHSGREIALVDLDGLPPQSRVLLVVNSYGETFLDPVRGGLAQWRSQRPLIRELDCTAQRLPGLGTFCVRMLLWGPRSVR